MSKKLTTSISLIIVESPAKCKKIEEYLGPGYKCVASYGHICELSSLKNINIENNFNPTYTIIDNTIKRKNIEFLRKEMKSACEVILATDDDREGEAIAWHVCEVFKLDINKTKRIIFHEITESALRKALENPRIIDMNIVNAQKTRQILDVLVGFKVSPILWKLVSQPKSKDNALSAGRCQTPALKLVYENQKEINKSREKKIYNTTGYFTNLNLPFLLNPQDKIEDKDEMIDFLDDSLVFSHTYTCSQPVKIFKTPPEPFTTSRLQQVASNELHYSPKETMRICQILYEKGYITYMRTDSKVYSDEFINSTFEYITKTYNAQYINNNLCSNNNLTKKQSKQKEKKINLAQEAHEAIRTTNISLQDLPNEIDSKERRMYKLIWTNTLESCMVEASFYSITASINAPKDYKYSYTTELIDFPGWKIVENKFNRDSSTYQYLQNIRKDSIIPYKKIYSKITVKGLKSHYTEANLVQLLEEKGIGRPSTFSSLIDKIQERGYVKKEDIKGKEIICKDFELEDGEICEIEHKREFGNEKNKLVIQQLGIIVMDFLDKYFYPLFNYEYTSSMETALDKIAKDELIWVEVCSSCNKEIDNLVETTKNETKFEYQLDENNTYMIGKYGPVIKCVKETDDGKEEITFKSVKKDFDVSKLETHEYEINDIIEVNKKQNKQYILGEYQGKDVILRKGKFGLYISWGENSKTLKELGNRPIENITLNEVKPFLEEGSSVIREINSWLSIRKGSKGDYIFYKNTKMKKPLFYDIKCFINETNEDYKICNITILKSWIENKYNIKV